MHPLLITAVATLIFVLIGMLLTSMILFFKKKLVSSDLCHIQINQDEKLSCRVAANQTLLAALGTQGIALPSPCGGKASCKQCRVQIIAGAPDPLPTDLTTFEKKEIKAGWRLSCQFKIKQPISIRLDEQHLNVQKWQATVISNENVASFIKELIVELPEGEKMAYRAGGYAQIHVPPFQTHTTSWKATMAPLFHLEWQKYGLFDHPLDFSHLHEDEVIRAYSFASFPQEKQLRFNVRIASPPLIKNRLAEKIPWGICSSYLFSLKKGDPVTLTGPYGESFMINDHRPLVFLIGGAGSSFGRSHVMHLFHTEKTNRQTDFWYGARSLKENIYQSEYKDLASKYPHFRYHLVLSEPTPEDVVAGWPREDRMRTNYLFRAFELGQLAKMQEPENALYYVCGPPLHNSSCLKLLDDYGVRRHNIVLDDFGS